jgi:hypothetical protein
MVSFISRVVCFTIFHDTRKLHTNLRILEIQLVANCEGFYSTYLDGLVTACLVGAKAEAPRTKVRARIVRRGAIVVSVVSMYAQQTCVECEVQTKIAGYWLFWDDEV